MKQSTINLIKIYNPKGRDWMNFKMKKNNQYTFHHIVKSEHGGTFDITNGALLTSIAHKYIHVIEQDDKELYDKLNILFKIINDSKKAPTEEIIEEIINCLENYQISNKYSKKHKKENYQKLYLK
ncbi:MAG: hypothetical protein RSB77_01205 [Bacilli bacterium]